MESPIIYAPHNTQNERCQNCRYGDAEHATSLSVICTRTEGAQVVHSYDHVCMQFAPKGNNPNALI